MRWAYPLAAVAFACGPENVPPPSVAPTSTAHPVEPSSSAEEREPVAILPESCSRSPRLVVPGATCARGSSGDADTHLGCVDTGREAWLLRAVGVTHPPCSASFDGPPAQCHETHVEWLLEYVAPDGS